MRYLGLLAACAVAASAQSIVPSSVQASVLRVLVTAIPSSDIEFAATNRPAFVAAIESSIRAGQTPAWYQNLPTDVKTLLAQMYPIATSSPATPVGYSVVTPTPTPKPSSYSAITPSSSKSSTSAAPVYSTGGYMSVNSTSIDFVSSATLGTTGGARPPPTSTAFTGGASLPTAVMGAGVAGVVGFLGMLAL